MLVFRYITLLENFSDKSTNLPEIIHRSVIYWSIICRFFFREDNKAEKKDGSESSDALRTQRLN